MRAVYRSVTIMIMITVFAVITLRYQAKAISRALPAAPVTDTSSTPATTASPPAKAAEPGVPLGAALAKRTTSPAPADTASTRHAGRDGAR